jgi:hypothetical protein
MASQNSTFVTALRLWSWILYWNVCVTILFPAQFWNYSCFDDAYSVHCMQSELFGFSEMASRQKAAGLALLEYNYFITEKKVIVNVGRHGQKTRSLRLDFL